MERPLADLLRPDTLEDVVGQRHLLGEGALLLAMTRSQARALRALCPEAKVELFLGDEEVPDPFGRGMEAYERTARVLEEGAQAIARRLQGA